MMPPPIGAVVLVNRGRYMFNHGVVEWWHPELGEHGFVAVRLIGLSGTPLLRAGRSRVPPHVLPPVDLVPAQFCNTVEFESMAGRRQVKPGAAA